MTRTLLFLLSLLASLPVMAQQVPNPMSKDGTNALLPNALSALTRLGLHGDLNVNPTWTGSRCFVKYKNDDSRPYCTATDAAGSFGFGKNITDPAMDSQVPTVAIYRDNANTVTADTRGGEVSALKIFGNIANTVPSKPYEAGQTILMTTTTPKFTTPPAGGRTVVGLHINATRACPAGTSLPCIGGDDRIHALNVQAIDTTADLNAPALTVNEFDLIAGGPDNLARRHNIVLIAKKTADYVGIDTSFDAMLHIRTASGVPGVDTGGAPSTMNNAILIDAGDSGRVLTGVNVVAGYAGLDGFGLDRAGREGVLITGTVQANGGTSPLSGGAHLKIIGDTSASVEFGGLNATAAAAISTVRYTGLNDAGARTFYGRIISQIGSPVAGAENGILEFSTMKAGTLTPALTVSGGSAHVVVNDTTDAVSSTVAGFNVLGGMTVAKKIYAPGLPTTGTATGSLCIDAAGQIYKKTTTGACL